MKNFSNIRFKTVIFGRQKSEDLDSDKLGKSSRIADSDPNSESVTALHLDNKFYKNFSKE